MEWRFVLTGLPRILNNLLRHPRNLVVAFWRAVRADVSAVAIQVSAPVLLPWGRWDFVMPVRGAMRLNKLLPVSQLHVAYRASHDWLIERPVEFADAVRSFHARVVKDRNKTA